ncbi:class I SAM-dependent methyltransferase [bacterium]|nr:class I SAM-dependent methyltransferase [bacterium]
MSQYFENDKNLKSQLKRISCSIFNKQFIFYTDNGVFAKNGIDYGSKLLLESIKDDKYNFILDMGCGYGTLGIILNKKYSCYTTMVDINKRALHLTKKNILENKCNNVEVFESDAYQNITKKYDLIVTNPPIHAGKKKVYEILIGAKKYLNNNGKLYFVIHKDQGAKSVIKDLSNIYKIEVVKKDKGFFIILAENS